MDPWEGGDQKGLQPHGQERRGQEKSDSKESGHPRGSGRGAGALGGLTAGPQVHRLPVRVLAQHFRGEVSGCPCEACSPDTQTGTQTGRHTDTQIGTQTGTDRQADTQTHRQADTQTDTHRQTHTQDTHTELACKQPGTSPAGGGTRVARDRDDAPCPPEPAKSQNPSLESQQGLWNRAQGQRPPVTPAPRQNPRSNPGSVPQTLSP